MQHTSEFFGRTLDEILEKYAGEQDGKTNRPVIACYCRCVNQPAFTNCISFPPNSESHCGGSIRWQVPG